MRVRTLAWWCARIPPGAACGGAAVAGLIGAAAGGARTRAWRENLRAAGLAGPRTARSAWRPLYHHLLLHYESLAMLGGRRFSVEVEGRRNLDEARAIAPGRGLLLATAHVGNWTLGARLVHEWTGLPVHSVAGVQMSEDLTPGLRLAYRSHGIRVHPRRSAPRAFLRALRRGEIVGLHLDGDQQDAAGPACRGIALLARRSGAPILPGSSERIGPGRLRVRFHAPIPGGRQAPEPSALARLLVELVRGAPEQWILFRPIGGLS